VIEQAWRKRPDPPLSVDGSGSVPHNAVETVMADMISKQPNAAFGW
jgi:hypothetical protein